MNHGRLVSHGRVVWLGDDQFHGITIAVRSVYLLRFPRTSSLDSGRLYFVVDLYPQRDVRRRNARTPVTQTIAIFSRISSRYIPRMQQPIR